MHTVSFLVPALLVLLFVPPLRWLAPALELVDLPDARKRHAGPVPLVGGLAMFAALALASVMLHLHEPMPRGFIVGATGIMLLGLADDRRALPVAPRVLVQLLAIWLALETSGNVLPDLGRLVGPNVVALGALALPVTMFVHLGVMNAVNLSDGADGLAGGLALGALFWFVVVFVLLGGDGPLAASSLDTIRMLLAVAGAVSGFLYFNMRAPWRARATVFMGDAGSLLLGFVLGWFGIRAASEIGAHGLAPVCALWILIVPVIDTVACMLRRVLQGHSPARPDRQHVHHLLQAYGLSPARAVAVLVAVNMLGGMIGVMGLYWRWPDYWMFAAFVACFAAYVIGAMLSWSHMQVRRPTTAAASGVVQSSF
jgi:UDP-GlcNAc:undecaprenyl-phosphate/decaprenyl-phosphate GlcNAc-1-phosphate transferase